MEARKIKDNIHDEVERLLNLTIHEIVFAVKHSEDDNPEDANQCLITAQNNIERAGVMLVECENA